MDIFKKILPYLELIILGIYTFFTYKIYVKASDTLNQGIRPFISLIPEDTNPYKFKNTGSGPALNIFIITGNSDGKIFSCAEKYIISSCGVNQIGQISKMSFTDISLEKIKNRHSIDTTILKKEIENDTNWIAVFYQDIQENTYLSLFRGTSSNKSLACSFYKIKSI